MSKHTRLPWGIERTDKDNWIGPMRADGKKIAEIVCHIDREDLKPEYLARNDADAELIVQAVNAFPRWRHLDTEKPAERQTYLVWDDERKMVVMSYYSGSDGTFFVAPNARLWMPLPASPTEEEKR